MTTHEKIIEGMHLSITDDDMRYRGAGALSRVVTPLLEELDSWKALRDVSTRMVPGEDGGGLELDPTPDSIREHLAYLQGEWDTAEKRIAVLETRIKEISNTQKRLQS